MNDTNQLLFLINILIIMHSPATYALFIGGARHIYALLQSRQSCTQAGAQM